MSIASEGTFYSASSLIHLTNLEPELDVPEQTDWRSHFSLIMTRRRLEGECRL